MHPNRQDHWPDRLHRLWRSAFVSVNTRQFAHELYTGLLELPGVHAVLGARLAADTTVTVTRWADATGLHSSPDGLADDITDLIAAPLPGDTTATALPELAHHAPGLAARAARTGADTMLLTAFDIADHGRGLFGLATTTAAGDPHQLTTALTQVIEVVVAADHRISEQRTLEDHQAIDALLAEASLRMDASLDITDTLRAVLRMVVPALADGAAVHIRRDDRMVHIAAAHVDARRETLLTDHLRAGHWAGEPVITDTGHATDGPQPAGLPTEVGLDTMTLGVLRARGRDVGLLTFFHRGTPNKRVTTRFLHDLASRAALAIDNATLYEQRRHDVRSLQQHLLPAVLPTVPGLEIAAGYNAADHTLDVGGDFYGVVDQPDGTVVALVGDVCGRGAPATALTGLARHTLETVLAEGGPAAHALDILNRKMLRDRITRFLTIATVTLHPGPHGQQRVETHSAGHPAPLIVRRDGTVDPTACRGRLVGVLPDLDLHPATDDLRPGDLLILFSDGLIEARDTDGGFYGDTELAHTLTRTRDLPLTALVDALLAGAGRYHVNDDVAVLAVRNLGTTTLDQVLPPTDLTSAVERALQALSPHHRLPEHLARHTTDHTTRTKATVAGDATWARVELTAVEPNGGTTWTELTT
ncbi:serine phosphatase RsbU (regulator of sigma subunit) [Actinokineospora baliensis]|uniref:PP2C family protein-serine/threonine phosphatase n=1 Tax=Actinokineospora baliensis TaxID=547056 RepID=UPI00195B59EC|nr:SpoIIE family protein phosphatase [Actinokineospora baliensis]MBM7774473.1 serine phosphatase RsbU (regulator of sigma subunit) [Actinokineospora baliensis]